MKIRKAFTAISLAAVIAATMSSCGAEDSSSEIMGELPSTPDVTTVATKATESKELEPTATEEESSATEVPASDDRYIPQKQTPKELFTALEYFNSDSVKWSREAISDDMLNSGESGVFYFCNEYGKGGNIELVMQNGKYIQYRNTTSIGESAGYSFEDAKKIAYEMFRDYIYVAFPNISIKDLNVAIKLITDWAEAITIDDVDKGNDKRTFTIGDEAVNISYILANGKEYGGFRCTIDL